MRYATKKHAQHSDKKLQSEENATKYKDNNKNQFLGEGKK